MLLPVMRETRNFFVATHESGVFEIKDSSIEVKGNYVAGQYVAITGSILNNGVKQIKRIEGGIIFFDDDSDKREVVNETFSGVIYGLAVPQDFIELCNEIQAFNDSADGKPSAITSETVLGLHSWSAATDKNGMKAGWQTVFSQRLAPFRRMFTEVVI